MEHAFGELKQRFRQLNFLKLRTIERIVKVIHACCVLHNLSNSNDISMFEDPLDEDSVLQDTEDQGDEDNTEIVHNDWYVKHLRDDLCNQISNGPI